MEFLPEFLISRSDVRDWAIILYCLLGVLLFFAGIVLVGVLIFAVMAIKGVVKDLVNESVKPTLASVRETAEGIKGTTEFVGQTAVAPIIKAYSMSAGVKRGLGVLSGLSRMRRR